MIARDFSRDTLSAVERLKSGRNPGCIVRWDFQPVKTVVPIPGLAIRKGATRSAVAPEEVDSGLVSYSEVRYIGIPETERVVADIMTDLDLRYGDTPRPEIDLNAYRTAIAALNKD